MVLQLPRMSVLQCLIRALEFHLSIQKIIIPFGHFSGLQVVHFIAFMCMDFAPR